MTEYQIVEILRTQRQSKEFQFVLLFFKNELVRKSVAVSANDKLLKGQVYKNDFIKITSETEEGIDFEIVEAEGLLYDGVVDTDEIIYGQEKHLAFLNDTLPYYNAPFEDQRVERLNATTFSYNNTLFYNALGNLNLPIVGKVVYKTRINLTVTNTLKFYFFFILEVNKRLLKVVVWRENIKYSSLRVGDVIGLQKYRINKGYSGLPCLDYNRFTEAAYFDVKEVTGTEMVKFDFELEDCDISLEAPPFEQVEGFISYKSVLQRRCHNGIDEFYLLVVDGVPIVLFYNSDSIFYEIEAGNKIKISNLRKIERANFTICVSTIYSQIDYEKIYEMEEACSSFLYEAKAPIKRPLDSGDGDAATQTPEADAKVFGSFATTSESEDVSFLDRFTRRKKVKRTDEGVLEVTPEDLKALFDGKKIAEVVEKSPIKPKNSKTPVNTFVDVAFGFIPDCFGSLDDIFREESEIIHNTKYTVPMFYRPLNTTIKELKLGSLGLMINEVTKWTMTAELIGVDFSNYNAWEEQTLNDGCAISYIEDRAIKEQLPAFVNIKDEEELTCYLFPNFFTGETTVQHLFNLINGSSSYEEVSGNVGKRFHFVVQAFRASDKNVLFVITGMFSEC